MLLNHASTIDMPHRGVSVMTRLDWAVTRPAALEHCGQDPIPRWQSNRLRVVNGLLMCEAVACIQVSNGAAAAWGGPDPWLRFPEFSNHLHSPPFSVLLGLDRWQACHCMSFSSVSLYPVPSLQRITIGHPQFGQCSFV